ncbi:hypothetical protein [Mitsuaria sp. GD03876]|uniref:hypothetical protein n=1 Tax=Mitsuaria sp. GD03876 TaxID=2975399 RepID=UPI002449C5A1|nr:hypothetical protein [Mitsuaria sp. GD03876]MDH0863146.1 hypothetical protein [Mitsuaria sp. GD03876]
MNVFAKTFVALTAAISWTSSFGGTASGRVSAPNFMPNGAVIFYVEGSRNSPPACATESRRFALNGATPQGKTQLSGLLLAYSQGKTVNVYGTNSCSVWGDTETLDFFAIVD